ncbi:MAG: hypothetical protein A2W23_03965 [Planctomycetes bacterium RBG_16_43_13]|nr:MAG: hypothetical protein A2W23_03965 [Planctomycetes bacterium RBG_16_43_13]
MARREQLVYQHLETISRDALEKYQKIIRHYIKNRHGIYALYRDNKLYYVGLASDLRFRLKQHLKDHHSYSWNRFSIYLTLKVTSLKDLESLILHVTHPQGNVSLPKFHKSENIGRRFKQDIKLFQRNEISAIFGVQEKITSPKRKVTVEGQAVLSKYIDMPLKLNAQFRGKTLKARVSKNGTIVFNGKSFTSPSSAGAAACKLRTCNGWAFWTYERAPGDWVKLDSLRK